MQEFAHVVSVVIFFPILRQLALYLCERIPWIAYQRLPFFRRQLFTDVLYSMQMFVLYALTRIVPIISLGIFPKASRPESNWEWLFQFTVLYVAYDLSQWLVHYFFHRNPILWEFHKVHHSATVLDNLILFRRHLLEDLFRFVFTLPIFGVLLYILDFHVQSLQLAIYASMIHGMLVHSNLRISLLDRIPGVSLLERIFVFPEYHRAHHCPESTHSNLAVSLIIWDRLAGITTWKIHDPAVYKTGLPSGTPDFPENFLGQFLAPIRSIFRRS